jgi:membrane-bound lytic murein transglycosylase A
MRRRGFARAALASALLTLLAACGTVPTPPVEPTPAAPEAHGLARPASFADLPGWQEDDLAAAFPAFAKSCLVLQKQPAWSRVCALARSEHPQTPGAVRGFFEKYLRPWRLIATDGGESGLVTGYYEPLLNASRTPDSRFRHALFAPPEDLLTVELADLFPELKGKRVRARVVGHKVVPYATRAEIEAGAAPLTGKEIAWVDDPVELFFLQIQGSGRLRLPDGSLLRVGYADQNGHPYRSIGKLLVERGELTLDQASMQGIKDWGLKHPDKLPDLLAANPSYVFFRELPNGNDGPPGAMGLALTPERSVAVDAREIPLGAPLYLATTRPLSAVPLERLVLAQDTGGAIRGPLRVDFFWGFGPEAASEAGRMRQRGSLWLLWPADATPALAR